MQGRGRGPSLIRWGRRRKEFGRSVEGPGQKVNPKGTLCASFVSLLPPANAAISSESRTTAPQLLGRTDIDKVDIPSFVPPEARLLKQRSSQLERKPIHLLELPSRRLRQSGVSEEGAGRVRGGRGLHSRFVKLPYFTWWFCEKHCETSRSGW